VNRPLAFLLVALPTATALAAGDAPHGEHHGIPWGKLIFSTINLLIFLSILRRFAWPSVREWLSARRDQIVADLESAARAKHEAEQLQAQWKERLAKLSDEIAGMRKQAQAEIEAEREQILSDAKQMADSIRSDAEKVAAQELRSAQAMLRVEVAKHALAIASRIAEERLSAGDQRRFVDEFLQQVDA
jgi:F-type H+-transporting ATPase subunit b